MKNNKDFTKEEFTEACRVDYQKEYHRQSERIKELVDENSKYKEALLKLVLKL